MNQYGLRFDFHDLKIMSTFAHKLLKMITKELKIYGKIEASAPKIHIRHITLHYPCIVLYIVGDSLGTKERGRV